MKPVSVTFQCFGPYMDRQFIDFAELEKNGLFLICGETGAGKTTILDAICYALYCESSGGQRGEIEAMRCKLAEKTDETLVEFVFDNHGSRYKFSRALKYKTKKLYSYHNCYMWKDGVWEVLDTGERQVSARAEKIVGLTSSQFRQVIILPQGKFEEFLVSNSKKKEEILVTLFNVQQWSRISEEIGRRVNARHTELNREKAAIEEGLRRYGCADLEALAGKREALENSLTETAAQAEAAAKALEAAEEAYNQGKLEHEAFARLQKAAQRRDQLQGQTAAMTREAETLVRADQAEILRPIHAEYAGALTAKTTAESKLKEAKKSLEDAGVVLDGARAKMADHEARQPGHTKNQKLLVNLEQAKGIYASLDGLNSDFLAARKTCLVAEDTLKKRNKTLDDRDRDLAAAFDGQKRAQESYDDAQLAYRRGIGGILAQTLEDGKPCPVCGSVTHPAPAEKAADHVSEARLDQLNKDLSRWSETVSKAMDSRTRAEKDRNTAQESFNLASQSLNSVQQRLELAREQRIGGIETAADLEANIRELNRQIRAYEDRGKQLLDQRTGAEAAHTAADVAVTNCAAALGEAEEVLRDRSVAWNQALEASPFDTEREFLSACLAPAAKQRRYQALHSWQADLKAAEENLHEQQTALEGRTAPDLAALKQQRDRAEKESRALTEKKILEGKTLKDMKSDEEKLAVRQEKNEAALLIVAGDQVFARRLAGSQGVGLQRYVLGVMMNSITAQANRLLENVYSGRYRLYRTDETSGRTLKGGLELEISDSHNNQRRSVQTLSGGEKFLVALSLAIGLSTVVQAQGKGIRLEAMFIDEGFGSLDREAIQDALEILQGIRRSAGVVGIISHVEALAESIPAQLQITKGKRGSSCRLTGV